MAVESRKQADWWKSLGELLERGGGPIVRGTRRGEFLDRWKEIHRKESALEDRLFIGLVGGTGVGKSTLINALAGELISKASDRRPTTDKVVVYRHASEALPQTFPHIDLATKDQTHDVPPLERLVFLDFPDFDSVRADHARILQSCLPHLDITFVVVDETKYGDRRLYEVLRSLPQSPENLYFVFNKIDRLSDRYGVGRQRVMSDLLQDFRAKIETYVGWHPPDRYLIAISALEAFRGLGEPTSNGDRVGEFDRVLSLLERYGAEKRRLAAKQINLDHLKEKFRDDFRESFVCTHAIEREEQARRLLNEGVEEAEDVLASVPQEVLGLRERRAVRSSAFRRLRRRLGFPMDLIFTVTGEWTFRRRETRTVPQTLLSERLKAHYASVEEVLKVFERNYRREVGESIAGPLTDGPRVDGRSEGPGRSKVASVGANRLFADRLERRVDSLLRFRFLRNHFLVLVAVLFFLWSLIQPVASDLMRAFQDDASFRWSSFLGNAVASIVQGLNPFVIFGFLFSLLFLYGVTALIVWSRLAQAVEDSITKVEEEARDKMKSSITDLKARLEDGRERWKGELEMLTSLVGERVDE